MNKNLGRPLTMTRPRKNVASEQADFSPDSTVFDQLAQLIHSQGLNPALFKNPAVRQELERRARIWSTAFEERLAYLKDHDLNAYAKLLMRFCNITGPLIGLWQRLDGLDQESGLQVWNMATSSPPIRPGIRADTLVKAGIAYDDYPHPDSIKIPYFSITGDPRLYTDANGQQRQFTRWRLPKRYETPQKKYHQRKGSPLFAYHLNEAIGNSDILALLEGEFKFLAAR
jgi:hypothetical protein